MANVVSPLRPYQRVAIDWCKVHPYGALLLDMGLGKTRIVLESLKFFPSLGKVLVVAPKRVAETVWADEIEKWASNFRVSLIIGSPAKRKAALNVGANIFVLGVDNLDWLANLEDRPCFDAIVFDELSFFKSHSSKRFKAAKSIRTADKPRIVWGLTGTPIGNHLESLWSELFLIDCGATFGRSFFRWREKYFELANPFAPFPTWRPKPDAKERLFVAMAGSVLSMDSAIIRGLVPDLHVCRVKVPLSDRLMRDYKSFAKLAVLGEVRGRDVFGAPVFADDAILARSAAALRNKLFQFTAGAVYNGGSVNSAHFVNDAKLRVLRDIVEVADGAPIMVMYRYGFERDAILANFSQAVDVRERGAVSRWNAGLIPVLVAHPASAGHGLNLQSGGSIQVWLTLPDSQEQWSQGVTRLHRPGQSSRVSVLVLECPGTYEEMWYETLMGMVSVEESLRDFVSNVTEW